MSPRLAAALSERVARWRGPWSEDKTKAEAVVDAIMDGRHDELGPLRLQVELEAIDEGRAR